MAALLPRACAFSCCAGSRATNSAGPLPALLRVPQPPRRHARPAAAPQRLAGQRAAHMRHGDAILYSCCRQRHLLQHTPAACLPTVRPPQAYAYAPSPPTPGLANPARPIYGSTARLLAGQPTRHACMCCATRVPLQHVHGAAPYIHAPPTAPATVHTLPTQQPLEGAPPRPAPPRPPAAVPTSVRNGRQSPRTGPVLLRPSATVETAACSP